MAVYYLIVSTHLWIVCNPKCKLYLMTCQCTPFASATIPINFVVVYPHIQGTAKLTKLF
jgi:hypothetical protein